jgi:hypothetical protein
MARVIETQTCSPTARTGAARAWTGALLALLAGSCLFEVQNPAEPEPEPDPCGVAAGGHCEPEPVCRDDVRYFAYGEQCQLVRFACPAGERQTFDGCGCGCEVVPVQTCPGPQDDVVPADVIGLVSCDYFNGFFGPELLQTPEQLLAFVQRCPTGVFDQPPADLDSVNFETHVIYAAAVRERASVQFRFVEKRANVLHVAVEAGAYCDGPPPPTTSVLVRLPRSEARPEVPVSLDLCEVGYCSGPPRP